MEKPLCLKFRLIIAKILGVRKFRSFTVNAEGLESDHRYHKVPKFWDARNLCYNLPKVQTKRLNPKVFLSKWCKWKSKQ